MNMLRSKIVIAIVIVQYCFAFHLPKQRAGLHLFGQPQRRGHDVNKWIKPIISLKASSDIEDFGENELLYTVIAKGGLGEYDFERKLGRQRKTAVVGAPGELFDEEEYQVSKMNITQVMTELQAIQSQGPKKVRFMTIESNILFLVALT